INFLENRQKILTIPGGVSIFMLRCGVNFCNSGLALSREEAAIRTCHYALPTPGNPETGAFPAANGRTVLYEHSAQSPQSGSGHAAGANARGRARAVRGDDGVSRKAGFRAEVCEGRRQGGGGHRGDSPSENLLSAEAFPARYRPQGPEAADRRADVGAFRNTPSRHSRADDAGI